MTEREEKKFLLQVLRVTMDDNDYKEFLLANNWDIEEIESWSHHWEFVEKYLRDFDNDTLLDMYSDLGGTLEDLQEDLKDFIKFGTIR